MYKPPKPGCISRLRGFFVEAPGLSRGVNLMPALSISIGGDCVYNLVAACVAPDKFKVFVGVQWLSQTLRLPYDLTQRFHDDVHGVMRIVAGQQSLESRLDSGRLVYGQLLVDRQV